MATYFKEGTLKKEQTLQNCKYSNNSPGAYLPTKLFWVGAYLNGGGGGGVINLEELWMTQNSWKRYYFFQYTKRTFSRFVQLVNINVIIGVWIFIY